jgi:hypothetical protein
MLSAAADAIIPHVARAATTAAAKPRFRDFVMS